MEVVFRRTGARRYGVTIFRAGYPAIEMNPAPGFDPWMPHDLLHFVIERELGMRRGIFGQIAEGGDAGTFHIVPGQEAGRREAARLRRKAAKRGARLMREGRVDSAESERVVWVAQSVWMSREKSLGGEASVDREGLSREMLDRVCAKLDEASRLWAALRVGESLTMTWPEAPVAGRGR